MNKRSRKVFFVCSAVKNTNELISEVISAASIEEASNMFYEKHMVKVKEIFGPFSKIQTPILENTKVLKFSDTKPYKAIYNDWVVNAFLLSEPIGHAYLVFLKRIDDKKIPFPKGTITAPTCDLRFINNE